MLSFLFALFLAVIIGMITCIPERQAGLGRLATSVAITTSVCAIAWVGSAAVGMSTLGPAAHIFSSLVIATTAVSVFHAYVSERAALR